MLLPMNGAPPAGKFISCADVEDLTLGSFQLVVRHSKTTQFGQKSLKLPFVSCPNVLLCPVRQLLGHLGCSPLPSHSTLCSYVQGGKEVVLTHSLFVNQLKLCIQRSGRDSSLYSGHSFRRGGASFCYMMGLSDIQIKIRGDWVSSAYERYVYVDESKLFESARVLAAGASDLALAL